MTLALDAQQSLLGAATIPAALDFEGIRMDLLNLQLALLRDQGARLDSLIRVAGVATLVKAHYWPQCSCACAAAKHGPGTHGQR